MELPYLGLVDLAAEDIMPPEARVIHRKPIVVALAQPLPWIWEDVPSAWHQQLAGDYVYSPMGSGQCPVSPWHIAQLSRVGCDASHRHEALRSNYREARQSNLHPGALPVPRVLFW